LSIDRDHKEAVGLWLLKHIPEVTDLPGGYYAIGVARGDALVGACLYTDYRPCPGGGNIMMYAAGHGWLSRRVIAVMLGHPFKRLNCHRITVTIRRGNKASRKLVEDLGFVLEGKVRRGFNLREDMTIYGLLRDECRWALEG